MPIPSTYINPCSDVQQFRSVGVLPGCQRAQRTDLVLSRTGIYVTPSKTLAGWNEWPWCLLSVVLVAHVKLVIMVCEFTVPHMDRKVNSLEV